MIVAVALQVLATVAAAWAVGGRTAPRRALAIASALVATVAALGLPEWPLLRFVMATGGMLVAFRTLDLIRDPRRWSLTRRLWLFTAMVDVRRVRPTPRRLDPRHVLAALAYSLVAAGGFALATRLAPTAHAPSAQLALRWMGGLLFIYGLAEVFNHATTAAYLVAGWQAPPLHRAPILASSVGAFWSKHYNLSVSAWLGRHCYLPWARRRRPMIGLLSAFVVSALFHTWLAFVPLDAPMALSMGTFFLVQAIVIALERGLNQADWPPALRHAWTFTCMVAASPLFTEPFLRIMGA